MKILMLSMDKTLLGEKVSGGDAIKRHQIYGSFCHELNIVVMAKKGYEKQILAKNVFVYATNSVSRYNFFWDAYKIGKQIYKNNPYDLVIGDLMTGFSAWLLKRKFKVKFLMHFHGDFWQNIKGLEKKWHNYFILLLSKFLVRKADGIRVVSSGIKNKLVKFGIQKEKIRVIPTPVDLSKFLNYDQAKVYELKQKYTLQESKNILFVGRLEKEKNLAWFLKVFKNIRKDKYHEVFFLIIGDGSLKNDLEKMVKTLDIKNSVIFIGQVNYEQLTNYFHLADVVVLPSTSESFGNVLVQAGAAGVPCVASATTGAKEIIQDGKTGFITGINNQKQMTEKIVKLLKDEKLGQKMGENAKKYVQENFDGDQNIKKIIKFWQELIF